MRNLVNLERYVGKNLHLHIFIRQQRRVQWDRSVIMTKNNLYSTPRHTSYWEATWNQSEETVLQHQSTYIIVENLTKIILICWACLVKLWLYTVHTWVIRETTPSHVTVWGVRCELWGVRGAASPQRCIFIQLGAEAAICHIRGFTRIINRKTSLGF